MTTPDLIHVLPAVNASLNGLAAILLTVGYIFIKNGRVPQHRVCMVSAFIVSAIFLCTYVAHKWLRHGIETHFAGQGFIRYVYFPMLISHVILAIVIVPLILITLSQAIAGRFDRHRAWARITYPLWYYVSVTGVLVYMFLYQWYPASKL